MVKQHSQEVKDKIRASKQKTALRHASMDVKCYELKIVEKKLNKEQKELLEKFFIEGKWLYNFILSEKKKREVPLNCICPTDYDEVVGLDKDKKEVVRKLEVLPSHFKQTIHARMISNEKTIRALVKKGLQKFGSLKFKSELNCIPLKGMDWKFKSKRKVHIMGIHKDILVRGFDQVPQGCEFANANLIKKPNGFYLKITTFQKKQKQEQEKTKKEAIGLDFGIKTTVTTSEGEKIDVSLGESERLKSLQKKLQRQKKGSNRRWKTIGLLRREYQKQADKKRDKANKIVHQMKDYQNVVFQDDPIDKWHSETGRENKGKRKKVQHSCIGALKAKLKNLDFSVVIARYIPTTRWCPKCNQIKDDLTLEDRVYECKCGHVEDRDIHAAKNMVTIWKMLASMNNLVPTEYREVKLEDWKRFQEDPRRCSIFR